MDIVNIIIKLILFVYSSRDVSGHARMLEPPARSSMWRFGFDTPVNYNDNQLFCGGYRNTVLHDGKCGVCGDPYQGPFENEAGGKFGTGIIGRYYDDNAREINVTIDVSAHHRGHFEFRICPNNDVNKRVTQSCLDDNVLIIKEGKKQGDGKMFTPPETGIHHLHLEIPRDLVCSQCVLQWRYTTGNFWGQDDDGTGCIGCGPQEQFVNCADIAVGDKSLFALTMNSTKHNRTINVNKNNTHHLHSNTEHGSDYDHGHSYHGEHRRQQDSNLDRSEQENPHRGSDQLLNTKNRNKNHHHNHDNSINSMRMTSYNAANTSHSSHRPSQCNRCYALPTWHHFPDMDDWCETNCKLGNCPPCRCYCGCPDITFENPCKGRDEYNQYSKMADWCWRECCESECPSDRCACSDDVKYPASYGVRIQKQFFDVPVTHLFPGSQIDNEDVFKHNHKIGLYRHEESKQNSHIAPLKDAVELSTLTDTIAPPEASLLTTNLFSNLWNKQWISLSGKIQPPPAEPKAQGQLHKDEEKRLNSGAMYDKTDDSWTMPSKRLGHSRGRDVIISMPKVGQIDNDNDNLLVSEVPADLLHDDNVDDLNQVDTMNNHQNYKNPPREKSSKQETSNISDNYSEHFKDALSDAIAKDDGGNDEIFKADISRNLSPKHTQITTENNINAVSEKIKSSKNTKEGLKMTRDNSVHNINEILTQDLKLDTLFKISDSDSLEDVKSHKYIYASPVDSGSNSKGDNSQQPYVVDVRFLNKILKSVKSWFNHPLYIVH